MTGNGRYQEPEDGRLDYSHGKVAERQVLLNIRYKDARVNS